MTELGTLEKVELCQVWAMESLDFVSWLSQKHNLELLSKIVGVSLSFVGSINIFEDVVIAKNDLTNQLVLVKYQLGKTNHDHLGQAITYASGISACAVVWLAEEFAEEHRSAVCWLNNVVSESLCFFAIELQAWKIGNSQTAIKFNVVVQPNRWNKVVRSIVSSGSYFSLERASLKADIQMDTSFLTVQPSAMELDGKRGRARNELDYALQWIPWADAGFPIDQCPWKNPYEFKKQKHRPKPDVEAQARRILAERSLE